MSNNNNRSYDFNNYINLILLLMFIIVVSVVFGFKCCRLSHIDYRNKIDNETLLQSADTLHDGIEIN